MPRSSLRKLLDVPSVWGLRILCVASLIVTCVLAVMRSRRLVWVALSTVLLLLLMAVNHVRIRRKIKRTNGVVLRRKKPHKG